MADLGPPGRRLRRTAAVGIAASALVLGVAGPASAATASSYGVNVNVAVVGGSTVDVGPLVPSTIGDSPNTVASASAGTLVTTGAITTTATADPDTGGFDSSATVADLVIGIGALDVTADAIVADCTAIQSGETGTVTLTGLAASLGGLDIVIPGTIAPNTQVSISVGLIEIGTLTLNEQIQNPDGGLTVNALHLELFGGVLGAIGDGDVIISSATCGPAVLPIPLAHGEGLFLGLGLVGVVTAGWIAVRRRRGPVAA